jgi:phospholipid/cholesterol/gamma-HCH transport system permease protein
MDSEPILPADPMSELVDPGERAFAIAQVGGDGATGGEAELRIEGRLTFADAAQLWAELGRFERAAAAGQTLNLDMSRVEWLDGGAMALLARLRTSLQQRGVRSEFVGAPAQVQSIIHLYGGDATLGKLRRRRAQGTLDQLGSATIGILIEIQLVLAFFGQMVTSALGAIRAPRTVNWRELAPTMERNGADAVPIVVLINFLVGLGMAYQASRQLERFGANLLVADMIGITVTRELGPLMTAIVLCGRSGAAFAAELGSMSVNEEIDALRTMGFAPMRFLVVPRALALILVLPLLTLLADGAGMLGGLVVGTANLGLTMTGYLNETVRAVSLGDVGSGLVKSVGFALAIALVSCQQGLATTGGAEGVGRRTTSSVVVTLFTLILVDAFFTVLFRKVGL